MIYPLNVSLPAPGIGYAVANDENEHAALTGYGYVPAYVAPVAAPQENGEQPTPLQPSVASDGAAPDADPAESDGEGHTVETARAQLDALGIAYDRRLGLAKLLALLPG